MAVGFSFPFQRSSASLGYFESTADVIAATNQNIKALLVTNWGERPMHFDMGCNMREFLFEQGRDDDIRSRIAERVESQFARWLPFLSVKKLFVMFENDDPGVPPNGVRVDISYVLVDKPSLTGEVSVIVP